MMTPGRQSLDRARLKAIIAVDVEARFFRQTRPIDWHDCLRTEAKVAP